MKAKDIFKKVQTFNELAKQFENGEEMYISITNNYRSYIDFTNYKEFAKYIKNEYIDEVAKPILNDDFEMIKHREYKLNVKARIWWDNNRELEETIYLEIYNH